MNQELEYISLADAEMQERARRGMLAFTMYTMPTYEVSWHHRNLCEALNRFVRGDVTRLMVFMPPRHGKSELVSRRLPAYLLGVNPDTQIISASYSDSLASQMNRDVQRIMISDEYARLFPISTLNASNVRSTTRGALRNSDIFEIVGYRGRYKSAGIGTGITGMGADCFPEGVYIDTYSGYRCISTLKVGDDVWSYNHRTGEPELQRIEAVSSRTVSRLVQVKTACGREVPCTSEHPFWTEEQGYIPASSLRKESVLISKRISPSEKSYCNSLLRILLKNIRAATLRIRKIFTQKTYRSLLLKQMFSTTSQLQKQKIVRNMRETMPDKNPEILQRSVHTSKKGLHIKAKSILKKIQNYCAANYVERQFHMLNLFVRQKFNSPSLRREQEKRFPREHDNSLQELPHQAPQVERGCVSFVAEHSEKETTVYNIQVGRNNNFFANGILVHNCAIIDDPIKDQAEADSVTYRERCWEWYTSTLYTRLEKGGKVLITLCMTGDTCVLMADGTEKYLKDIKVGDTISTYDCGHISTSTVKNWKCQGSDFIFKIRTSSGTSVKANERHPFLVYKNGELEWVRLRDLKVNDKMIRVGVRGSEKYVLLKDAKNPQSARDIAHHTIIRPSGHPDTGLHQLIMNPEEETSLDIDTALNQKTTSKCFQNKTRSVQSVKNTQSQELICHRTGKKCASITTTRQKKCVDCSAIIAILSSKTETQPKFYEQLSNIYNLTLDTIVEISSEGVEDVFDIQVDRTENFIANGLVSHNTR
jgi:intein/homing endonuclease